MTIDYALIAARSRNSVIGRDDEIPWHVKGEQALFKKITLGGCLLMGRRTFESIGRALPGRISIVITRQQDYAPEGCHVAHTLEAAFHSAEHTKR
ncbi:MAG: dihydrofolate reductase, partial [Pseudomonadales bacterium]